MSEFLGVLAFSLLVAAQFLAVIAVHRLKRERLSNVTDRRQVPGFSDRDLHLLAERLHTRGEPAR